MSKDKPHSFMFYNKNIIKMNNFNKKYLILFLIIVFLMFNNFAFGRLYRIGNYEKYVANVSSFDRNDVSRVGTKAARTGEFIRMHQEGKVVDGVEGFVFTTDAFDAFMEYNEGLREFIAETLRNVDYSSKQSRMIAAEAIYDKIINHTEWSEWLSNAIKTQYNQVIQKLREEGYSLSDIEWAVRSTSPGEDTGKLAAAGMFDTLLYQSGLEQVLESIKHCIAHTFNERAIKYFNDAGLDPMNLKMAVLVQRMLIDQYAAGVAFGYDPDTGKRGVYRISSSYGQGEGIVQGVVDPDIYEVTIAANGYIYISDRDLGEKKSKVIRAPGGGVKTVSVTERLQDKFTLTDTQVFLIAQAIAELNKEFGGVPQDVEFGFERVNGELKLKILQARDATARLDIPDTYKYDYDLAKPTEDQVPFVQGHSAGVLTDVVGNILKLEGTAEQRRELEKQIDGHTIVVVDHTTPSDLDWMEDCLAFITVKGGADSHAAITAREKGLLGVIGYGEKIWQLRNGESVTVRGTNGDLYKGTLSLEHMEGEIDLVELSDKLKSIPDAPKLTVIAADPNEIRKLWMFIEHELIEAVGLMRAEHVLRDVIKIHPLALLDYDKGVLKGTKLEGNIEEIVTSNGYENGEDFYMQTLQDSILRMASNFVTRGVDGSLIYRLSDFKTEEYMALVGGRRYEEAEDNFMAGWRGVGRMLDNEYTRATDMELTAFLLAYDKLSRAASPEFLKIMVPIVRTPEDLASFKQRLADKMRSMQVAGLIDSELPLPNVIMMHELPVNAVLSGEFSALHNGESIGTNDDTLLNLFADTREGEQWAKINERIEEEWGIREAYTVLNPVVLKAVLMGITAPNNDGKYNGICGQAPSSYPDIVPGLLMALGLENIGLDIQTIVKSLPVVINAMYEEYQSSKSLDDILAELGISVGYHADPRSAPEIEYPFVISYGGLSSHSLDYIEDALRGFLEDYSRDDVIVYKTNGEQNSADEDLNPLFGFYGMAKMLWDNEANAAFRDRMRAVLSVAKDEGRKINIELNMVRIPLEAKLAVDLIDGIAQELEMNRGEDYAIGMSISTPGNVNGIDDGHFIYWKGEKILDFLAWNSESKITLASGTLDVDFNNSKVTRRLPFEGEQVQHALVAYLEIVKAAAENYHIPIYLQP